MLIEQDIVNFCNSYNYDVRISGNGRWIDQKCAADVMTIISDCIYNYIQNDQDLIFTTPDIWHSKYSVENVQDVFKKPGVESDAAKNEYDKFFQQPMELLAYAKVLKKIKKGNRNYYKINNIDVLEYIALREKNALFFLKTYIEKVLSDSNILYLFDDFFTYQTKESYEQLKNGFSNFTIINTKINKQTECNRIFIKVLNPLAYYKNACGTEKGIMSRQKITYDKLMYNRNNFRDIYADKPKAITRKEYSLINPVKINNAYYKYQSIKAKNYLKIFNNQYRDGKTEHIDAIHINDKATHMHHIFPESEYPSICYYYENLIALTPTQHLNYAHPNGRTQEINEQYQHLLLLSKTEIIRENIYDVNIETIYDFEKLKDVLEVGFDDENIENIDKMDFISLINVINIHYAT